MVIDKAISDLMQALQITVEDLFVLEQGGEAKKLKGETLLKFITLNVVSVTVTTLPAGSSATATYDKSTNTLALGIPQGKKGDTGATGATGPANVLTIGSVTSGKVASATITGESPNQVLNLVLKEGEQGPEGPVGGSSNFVRYDAAQSLTDAQKTQARGNIGAAPSGGGVMERSIEIIAASASESYDTFCAKIDAVLATMPDNSVKFLGIFPPQYYGLGTDMCALYKADNNYASVYTIGSYNFSRQGFRMVKRKLYSTDHAGQWDPLEYINPEMKLGVEYRTTERYLGKPVYVKVVDFGSLPNNTIKVVTFGDNTIKMISAHGIMDGGYVIPGCTGDSGYPSQEMQIITADGGEVGILTHTDRSNRAAVIVAKYWKTTD